MKDRKKAFISGGIIFLIVAAGFILIQAISGLYPFGSKSNLIWDLDIQYVDYFAYYRDVLLGKASIGYSFSKSLGGSLVALFGYYLASPLNLFVVFFTKEQLPLFIFLLTTVKLGLSGVTASVFMRKRFREISENAVVLISVAYGLMQYSMLQLSNIMWLDGVIFLPLVLLGVYLFITEQKKAPLFFSMLFLIAINWYTGYMVGLFAVCYFIYERVNLIGKCNWKEVGQFLLDGIKTGALMLLGVLGGCFIFYPVFKGLQNGKDVFDLAIFSPAFYDSFFDVFRGFSVGSIMGTVSLYCGMLFFVFFIYYFFCREVMVKEKILSILAVLFMFLSCWFVPLDCIWSGLRFVASYRFRYSFIFVFLVLFIAARGVEVYEKKRREGKSCGKKAAAVCGGCALLFVLLQFMQGFDAVYKVWITVGVLVIYGVVFLLQQYPGIQKAVFAIVLLAELVLNGVLTFQWNYSDATDHLAYTSYVDQEQQGIDAIRKQDDSKFFRMDTTSKRDNAGNQCSAYLNESVVYGYSSIAHYSSTFDSNISDMIYDLGYSTETDLSIFGEAILPSDSLFGVKYLLSASDVYGYEKQEELGNYNGKFIYENPYALGLGMMAADSVTDDVTNKNPFLYQNELFSNILGYDVELFKAVEPVQNWENSTLTYTFPSIGGENLLYGNVKAWNDELDLALYVDDVYRCSYSNWLSYQVFNIGTTDLGHTVRFDNYIESADTAEGQFYYLDKQVFEQVINQLRGNEMKVTTWKDGIVEGSVNAQTSGKLLLSIPYDESWSVTVNGKEASIESGAGALTVVPVEAGENEIEMRYHIPGLKMGMILSVFAFIVFGVWCIIDRKKKV